MEPIRDPEGIEIEFLKKSGVVQERNVVEIGCGNGRLIWRYADFAASVFGVDPDAERVAEAVCTRPETGEGAAAFAVAKAEMLPFSNGAFECAVFGWSL